MACSFVRVPLIAIVLSQTSAVHDEIKLELFVDAKEVMNVTAVSEDATDATDANEMRDGDKLIGSRDELAAPVECTRLEGFDCKGEDILDKRVHSWGACCDLCMKTQGCRATTWSTKNWMGIDAPTCYLKSGCTDKKSSFRGSAVLVQTSRDSDDRLTVIKGPDFYDDFVTWKHVPVVDVSSRQTDQEIVGFGGAFSEAASVLWQKMTAGNRNKLIKLYFDAEEGIGYTVGRVHINSCDFSPKPAEWSEDDYDEDFDLEYFDMSLKKDNEAIIPFVKAGLKQVAATGRKLKLVASPWSPPAWMKTNGRMNNMLLGNIPGVANTKYNGKLKPGENYHKTWADYFVKWITAYKNHDIPIWAVTPQNEPEFSAMWEACVWSPEEQADWVGKYLGPQLTAAHPGTLIFPYDHNKDHVYEWAKAMYTHPTAAQYTAGISFHWYSGDEFDNVQRVHDEFPQAMLLPSEVTVEKLNRLDLPGRNIEHGVWKNGEGYGHDIMGDLKAGSVGYIDWNLALDTWGGPNHVNNFCDAPMYVDNAKQELYIHPQYWYIGHFSKYLVPGSRRIKSTVTGTTSYTGKGRAYGTCTAEDGLDHTAFVRPDGKIALVVLNCADVAIDFKIKQGKYAAAANVPAHGIQTYIIPQLN